MVSMARPRYLRQAGVRFTDYLADTLHDNAEVVRLIVAYFHADPPRNDPAHGARSRRASTTSSIAPARSQAHRRRSSSARWAVERRRNAYRVLACWC